MGTPGPSPEVTLRDVLDVFNRSEDPATPFTAREVAEDLDCARRTAFSKLETLAESGELESKKTGARGRIWWRPVADGEGAVDSDAESIDHDSIGEAQFHELVRTVSDYGIFVLDPDGHIITWNDGAASIKGYEEDEIIGEHFSVFYSEEDREAGVPERNLAEAAEHGRVEDEGHRVRKDGTTFWANVVITALRDDDGDLSGFIKVTRDMTERHEYEEQLQSQRNELEELNRINAVIRDIDQVLVGENSREAVERAVCDRLVESEVVSCVWIGDYAASGNELTVRSQAGMTDDQLDELLQAGLDGSEVYTAGLAALETGAVQPVGELVTRGSSATTAMGEETDVLPGQSAIAIPLAFDGTNHGVLMVHSEDPSGFDRRKIAVFGELGETIGHAITAIKRKEREQALTELHKSTRALLHAESPGEIGDIVVSTATDLLDGTDAILFLFDTAENSLDPVSASLRIDAAADELSSLTAGQKSVIWNSYVEGETTVVDTSTERAFPHLPVAPQEVMTVPIGQHGLLVVTVAGTDTFDADQKKLVELIAATAEAGLDRVTTEANLRERDEILQQQNRRLQRLNQINTIIRDIDKGLVQASSRDEIVSMVCERLTDSDPFRFAWIGATDDSRDTLAPEAWSGVDSEYLDQVSLALTEGNDEPSIATARSGEYTIVENVADDLREAAWRKEAFSRELQSVISVPLRYGEFTYGVLSVYAMRPGEFGEMEQSVFSELGRTIGNAINAVETKRGLLGDRVVELEFRLGSGAESILSRVANGVGCDISFEGIVPLDGDRARLFFTARDTVDDEVVDVLEESSSVESNRCISSRDDDHLFEAVVRGSTLSVTLIEHGATFRDLTVSGDEIRVKIVLPVSADVRRFIEMFQATYEEAEFLARRNRDRPVQTREGFHAELEEYLTDRQLEVLKTAYYSGYFESPRQSSGEEIAGALDVTQPTVTEHLRLAQGKMLELVFDEGMASLID